MLLVIKNYNYENILLRVVWTTQWRFSIQKIANVYTILRMRILILLEPLCFKFEWINNLFISSSILTNIIHLYNYDNVTNFEIGWNHYLIISFFPLNII